MNAVIFDQATIEKLRDAMETIEVRDDSGKVIGHFIPQGSEIRDSDAGEFPYSDEEVQLLRQQTGGRPLNEIWKSLGRDE